MRIIEKMEKVKSGWKMRENNCQAFINGESLLYISLNELQLIDFHDDESFNNP